MSPSEALGQQEQKLSGSTTALGPTDANWAYAVGHNRDLYAIARRGGSGRTEVHVMSASSGYQTFILQIATPITTDGNWEFAIANDNGDLLAIQKCCEGYYGRTVVYVLTRASNYQSYSGYYTPLGYTHGGNWEYAVAPNRDLFAIRKQGAASTEVYVLSASSNYTQLSGQTGTALHPTDGTWEFEVALNRDVVAIRKANTGSGRTERHVLDATTGYQSFRIHQATSLGVTDSTWEFEVSNTGALYGIKKSGTGSGRTEVYWQTTGPAFAMGYYFLKDLGDTLCAAVANGNNATQPSLAYCHMMQTDWSAHWLVEPQNDGTGTYRVRNRFSGKCLAVAGYSQDTGARIIQWDCVAGSGDQRFLFGDMGGGAFTLSPYHSGKCVDYYTTYIWQ
ncbi:MAG TPA: RICIN domain-containing protein, partial [Archangium sp.]|nr:RICIN domain-containing protein [Archangium sp.]